jgi:heavy metal sensor kinase
MRQKYRLSGLGKPPPSGRGKMLRKRDLIRFSRGLRFRLTAGYALFFALLLIGVAALFRQRLASVQSREVQDTLEQEWAAMKGYLRIEKDPDLGKYAAAWYYDDEDPDETTIVLDIQKVYVITDADGNVIPNAVTKAPEISTAYENIGLNKEAVRARVRQAMAEKKPKLFWLERKNSKGEWFQIRSGIVYGEGHGPPFYVAIGVPLAQTTKILREFTWVYIAIIPAALILGSLLGWIIAGRALAPVKEITRTAQRISGSNLSLRIPLRHAGDELDYLILTFNRMIERLEASFQQMKQFSADVSHELRTPITAIRGQLEVALFTAQTTEQYREAMFNALQDIDRLSQIVRALLLLSQAESGQLVLQKARMDLCEVVRDQVDQFQIPAEEAGVRLRAELLGECPALVDRVQVERMLTNLLSNAIKFTPRGGEVRVAARRLESQVEIVVEDTGRGIPAEALPHIFDRFYRVPGSGSAPSPEQGLGLGLSFVAWIVKAHRGKISVDSTPGQGTRFTITLPSDGVGSDTLEAAGSHVTAG